MNSTRNHGIGRREFLILSSSAAVATATIGPDLLARVGETPKSVAVGFVPMDAAGAAAPETLAPNVVAANRVMRADREFLRQSARVTVFPLGGRDSATSRSMQLLTHFPGMVTYQSWGCDRDLGSRGKTVSFNVPAHDGRKLTFSVATEQGTQLPVELSLAGERGGMKLSRGYYVIVPLFEGDREPRWRSYELRNQELHHLSGTKVEAVSFEHFVVRVDYADALTA